MRVQTVEEYFSDYNAPAIFNSVLTDLQTWSECPTLTTADIKNLIVERFAALAINGTPSYTGFSRAVEIWQDSRRYYFEGLYNTTKLDYNPIDNVDETTTETTTRTPDLTHTSSGSETDSRKETLIHGLTITSTDTVQGKNAVTTYNSNSFVDDSQSNQTGSGTQTNSGQDTTQHGGGISRTSTDTESGNEKTTFDRRRSGNIGVTSSQQLIEAERQVRDLDILQIWLERFAERFFIPIYVKECNKW